MSKQTIIAAIILGLLVAILLFVTITKNPNFFQRFTIVSRPTPTPYVIPTISPVASISAAVSPATSSAKIAPLSPVPSHATIKK